MTSYDLKTGSDCVLSVIFELSMSDLPYGLDFSAKGNVEFGPPPGDCRWGGGGGGSKFLKMILSQNLMEDKKINARFEFYDLELI